MRADMNTLAFGLTPNAAFARKIFLVFIGK